MLGVSVGGAYLPQTLTPTLAPVYGKEEAHCALPATRRLVCPRGQHEHHRSVQHQQRRRVSLGGNRSPAAIFLAIIERRWQAADQPEHHHAAKQR